MSAKENLEERLEKLGQAIASNNAFVENVMSRIEATPRGFPDRIGKLKNRLIVRRIIMSRFTKLAAAAAIIVAALVGLNHFTGSIDVATPAYGITDVPELFKKASVIHTRGWMYFPRHKMPKGQEIPPVEMEQWIDLENGRVRFTGVGLSIGPNEVRINLGETVSDGQYKMCLNHTDKSAIFFKISNYQRMLEKHHSLNQMFGQMFGDIDELDNFVKTGQEEINGVEYDIWEGEVVHSVTNQTERYKYCLSPTTGESGQVQAWVKLDNGQWALNYEYCLIGRDVPIPEGIFTTEAPEGYALENTKETATPLELDDGGSVHYGSLTLDPRISFTLSDGSVILAWYSTDRESTTSQAELFEDLEFGGALPKLPVEIYALKPSGWTGDITYIGQHLAYTQKAEKFIEWGIYVPDGPPPKHSEMLGYEVLYRFNLGEHRPNWILGYTVDYGILIETAENFDWWVLGAMAELSNDGKAPEGITYESVLKLTEHIRESLVE